MEHGPPLAEGVAAAVDILTEGCELLRAVAGPETEKKATAGKRLKRRCCLGHVKRVTQCQHRGRRAERNALGSGRDAAKRDERIEVPERFRIPGPVQRHVPNPVRREPQRIGAHREVHLLAVVDRDAGRTPERRHDADRQRAVAEDGAGHGRGGQGA
nr:hypothetical protein [Acuticoccus sediminis]